MKNLRMLGLLSAAVISLTSLPFTALTASAANVGDTLSVSSNGKQQYREPDVDGYSYEIWIDNTGGSGSMTLGSGGTFKAEWSASVSRGNFLARRGRSYDTGKKATTYDPIVMNYAADYSASGGNSRLCVYGWFRDPLVEYYIIEDWVNWCPSQDQSKQDSHTAIIDGAEYEIFWLSHTGPDITGGSSTFKQYFSVRKDKRTSGSITVTDHFKEWEKSGWGIGSLYEVALNAEGWESSGSANVTKLTITSEKEEPDPVETTPGDDPIVTTPTTTGDVKYTAPSGSGTSISDDFEGSGTVWSTRGDDCKYGFTDDMAHGGTKSLYVTGRTDYWNGLKASGSELTAGGSYDIEAYVAQKSGSSKEFTLGLQYNLNGQTQYDDLFTATGASADWAKIGGAFTVPTGATNISLYVQCGGRSDSSLASFYLDDVKLTSDGSSPVVTTTPEGGQTTSEGWTDSYPYKKGGTEFRDIFGPYFRIGTCLTASHLGGLSDYLKNNYNSITLENEMKPDTLLNKQATQQTGHVVINLNNASGVLKFCEQNHIGVRGHTFVWYSQTPTWFFRENFQDNGAFVSKEVMNQRLEEMIKNTFDKIQQDYPNLDLYAYDVCNELFLNDGGGLRKKETYSRPGDSWSSGGSDWAKVYGEDNNEFIINAFKYARQYAPAGCKLYMNDYNEYMPDKRDNLVEMAKAILAEGPYIDGIGMQSHLSDKYPDAKTYEDAILAFSALGLDVQVTELDITKDLGDSEWNKAYEDIFNVILKHADKISSVTLWGVSDNKSWRGSQSPLLWTGDGIPQAKPIYKTVCDLVNNYPIIEQVETTAPPVEGPSASEAKVTILGDADLSGVVDISDAVLIARYNVEDTGAKITEVGKLNADVNQNGAPDNNDVIMIVKQIAHLISF